MVLGYFRVPDEFYVLHNEKIDVDGIYSLDYVGQEPEPGKSRRIDAEVKLLSAIPVKSSTVTVVNRRYVVAGGNVFGLRIYTDGVLVVGMSEVETAGGGVNPAKKAGIKQGDVITEINGTKITRNLQASLMFENSGGRELALTVRRNGASKKIMFTPVLSKADGKYRAGLWIRDSSAGVGIITFYDRETGVFGGLGHAICDSDTGEILPLLSGDSVETRIRGCYKGSSGKPGELCGVFGSKNTGTLLDNTETGVYGVFDSPDKNAALVPVAMKQEVKTGKARIITTVSDEGPESFEVEITKIYSGADQARKNMVIKVTDKRLIEKTGGIVQGMSGSPIIQNGMLVGAVTHVFVSDPVQGYAIFAENMLNSAKLAEEKRSSPAA